MWLRFRLVSMVTGLALLACMVGLMSNYSSIQAQGSVTPTPVPVRSIVTSNHSAASFKLVYGWRIPSNGVVVADLHINNTATVFFDTKVNLAQYCRNAFLYRLTEAGDLIAHPFSCNGNTLSFTGMGNDNTADYYIAVFSSANAAQAAPHDVILSYYTMALGNKYTP
ncbi:MAG: hypothetical protein ABI947_24915 [Chloroflexota bacterium]